MFYITLREQFWDLFPLFDYKVYKIIRNVEIRKMYNIPQDTYTNWINPISPTATHNPSFSHTLCQTNRGNERKKSIEYTIFLKTLIYNHFPLYRWIYILLFWEADHSSPLSFHNDLSSNSCVYNIDLQYSI